MDSPRTLIVSANPVLAAKLGRSLRQVGFEREPEVWAEVLPPDKLRERLEELDGQEPYSATIVDLADLDRGLRLVSRLRELSPQTLTVR